MIDVKKLVEQISKLNAIPAEEINERCRKGEWKIYVIRLETEGGLVKIICPFLITWKLREKTLSSLRTFAVIEYAEKKDLDTHVVADYLLEPDDFI